MNQLEPINNINKNHNDISFTKDQENAINTIIDFISEPFDSAKHIIGLSGAGGTGKTFITNYIIMHCKYANSVIKCASPTHKACRVFSQAIGNKTVDTIQSIFGLRLDLKLEDFDPNRPQFNPMSGPKLDNIKLLLIDEASMIPAKLVGYICKTCKNLQIKIIFIGDNYQLAPVNEFKSIAFDRCYKVCYLNEVVRQELDNPILGLLDLLRKDIKNKTYDFLNFISKNINIDNYNKLGKGYTICTPIKFKELIDSHFSDEEYTKNIDIYRIIGYTNSCISGWNNYIRNTIVKDSHKNIITKNDLIMSYETIVDEFMSSIINNSEEYIIHDIIDFVDNKYNIKGFLVKFQLIHGGEITKPLFVVDHKDKYSIIKYVDTINELLKNAKSATIANRVSKWKDYYNFKKKFLIASNIINRNNGTIMYSRDIDYGFAITAHKSQGSTYENIFVDVNDIVYNKFGQPYTNQDDLLRRLYVACSRAKNKLILCYGK